jgi:hypothetical protein
LFYGFNDISKKVADDQNPPYPRESLIWFFKCQNTVAKPIQTTQTVTDSTITEKTSDGSNTAVIFLTILLIIFIIIIAAAGAASVSYQTK